MPEKVMVIGSNCFTGAHIVDGLLSRGVERVIGVSRSPQPEAWFLPYRRHDGRRFQFEQLDLRHFAEVRRLLDRERPAVVINVAALSEVALSLELPTGYFQTNTLAVVELCDHLRRCDWLRRYIHISSAEMLGSCSMALDESAPLAPSTPYAVSKAATDMFINTLRQNFAFPATLIRSTNVYGACQQLYKIIPRTAIFVRLGKTIELHGGGGARKSFVHIRDVVDGLLRTMERDADGTFHLSAPSDHSVADVVNLVCQKRGVRFADAARSVGDRPGQDARYWLDCSRAQRELGWQPQVSLSDGIDEVIDWIDAHWEAVVRQPLEYVHKP